MEVEHIIHTEDEPSIVNNITGEIALQPKIAQMVNGISVNILFRLLEIEYNNLKVSILLTKIYDFHDRLIIIVLHTDPKNGYQILSQSGCRK